MAGAHPLPEVLLLVVCASIASCDDFDDIAAWGENHLPFLRRFLPFHHGVPGARWLNILFNRIDPDLFSDCFMARACELRPDAPDLIAIDGKTSRRSHDRSAGKAALHLLSAFATREKRSLRPSIPSAPKRATHFRAVRGQTPAARAAASGVCPLSTCLTTRSRPSGVSRAFLWMFIQSSERSLKLHNSSFLAQDRVDNLWKAHT